MRRTLKNRILSLLLVIALALSVLTGCSKSKTEGEQLPYEGIAHDVDITFINVGRADATLVQIDDKNYLIDTGLKDSYESLINALKMQNVTDLDGLILTHTHKDHIGGVKKLQTDYGITMMYAAILSENKDNGENKITNLSKEYDIPLTRLNAGDIIPITDDVSFEVLGPLVYNSEDDNDNSLVLRLIVNGRTILFAGDMQFAEEETLMDAGTDLRADILKVGNHGNPDATSDAFAKAVSPAYAFISTDTTVDHNSANVRVKAALSGAQIFITEDYDFGIVLTIDSAGSIVIESLKEN